MVIFDSELDPDENLISNGSDCRHSTISEYNSCYIDCGDDFSLLNINLQSFHAKKSKFEGFLAAVHDNFDVLVLTETWNCHDNVNLCNMNNYNGVHTYRSSPVPSHGGIGGGVSVFVDSTKYNVTKIDNLSVCSSTIETCTTKILPLNRSNNDEFIVIAVYRPHTDSIENFIDALHNILTNNVLHNKTIFIAGDMNIDLTNYDSSFSVEYLNMLHSLNYFPAITKPTRFPTDNTHRSSTIDHIFVNTIMPFNSVIFKYDNVSDHCATVIRIESFLPQNVANIMKKTFSFRPYSDANLTKLENKLIATDWGIIFSSDDVNTQFNDFQTYLSHSYCSCFPLKTKTVGEKRKKNPWISGETLQLIRQKSEYYKLYNNGVISRVENNRLRNKLNKKIEKEKTKHYKNLFENSRGNMKRSWNVIRSLTGSNAQKSDFNRILEDSPSNQSSLDTLNRFNDFFSSIGAKLSSQLNYTNTSESSTMQQNPNTFFLFPPNQSEIEIIIQNLKVTKTHINSMPVKIFKKLKHALVQPLMFLIGHSFAKGIFPETLKLARITPIHKSGDFLSPNNFRPISSLPFISKIYEKFIARRLLKFFHKYKIISPKQYGFQSGISTGDALINLTEEIYKALDEKKHYIAAMVDIKKAFDCVDHVILLRKLEAYGIRGQPLDWIRSYLKDRKCYIDLNGVSSNKNIFNIGVPQGSILGPVLFLVHINDLPLFSTSLSSQMFADDTIVSYSGSDITQVTASLSNELDKLSNWMCDNKLTINPSKTEMLMVSNRIQNQNDFSIRFLHENIPFSSSSKYLGIYLDNKLNFKDHIEYVTKKVARHTGILYKIKQYLPMKARLNYYYGYIYPYLNYNIIVWGGACASALKPLITQQKRTIRIISDAEFREHTDPLFKCLNILKIEDIYKLNLLLYVHKSRSQGNFQRSHNINTRSSNFATPMFHRLGQTQRAVSYAGPNAWNDIPHNLQEIEKLSKFKSEIKKLFVGNYNS